MRSLNLSDLAESNEEYPCLKHQKAARIRYFAPVALELAKETMKGKLGSTEKQQPKS